MNKLLAFIVSIIIAIALTLVVGFVVASINGYEYNFSDAVPYGVVLGLIIYFFGSVVTASEQS
ncbi:VIT1/CCC1 family predicted Fe2+/Mn2+ transporter [Caldalkalibacillus uzonensis]|uniref:VIT1/CCC1 family predicted Fe2+/Mn2+ transporter n=1 Tax=Caldalkalibacillus uzonensis TaxID=353224 RepID=A0ABU0CVB5_9BACI|nr:DUF2929 family protein [Caldalkalibacillus uzonensis]MDQ0340038.1 VIT1/CCC1 family predicted Fe2+/Mn2+ transporter [Caldalkalibacillus uzonensis]